MNSGVNKTLTKNLKIELKHIYYMSVYLVYIIDIFIIKQQTHLVLATCKIMYQTIHGTFQTDSKATNVDFHKVHSCSVFVASCFIIQFFLHTRFVHIYSILYK